MMERIRRATARRQIAAACSEEALEIEVAKLIAEDASGVVVRVPDESCLPQARAILGHVKKEMTDGN